MAKLITDKYGRKWAIPEECLCPKCNQPDVCGDCTCGKITNDEALSLGAILPKKGEKFKMTKRTKKQKIKKWAIL